MPAQMKEAPRDMPLDLRGPGTLPRSPHTDRQQHPDPFTHLQEKGHLHGGQYRNLAEVRTRLQGRRSAHTLWDAGELHRGGMQGVARRSRWAMTTTAVCCKSMARSLSCGRVRYLRKLSLGLKGPDRNCRRKELKSHITSATLHSPVLRGTHHL